jgi:hypothetical protein
MGYSEDQAATQQALAALQRRIQAQENKGGATASIRQEQIAPKQVQAWHLSDGAKAAIAGTIVPADTVAGSTSFGQAPAAGNAATYSRGNHVHGTPAAPTAGSVGAEPANANIQAHVTGTGSPHTAAGVGAEPTISSKKTAFNVDFGTTAGTACQGNDARLGGGSGPDHTKLNRVWTEFLSLGANQNPPWLGATFGSGGTFPNYAVPAEVNHPGVGSFKSGAGANTGYQWLTLGTTNNGIITAGGEKTVFIFKVIAATAMVGYVGFRRFWAAGDPTDDAACFHFAGLNLTGMTYDGQDATQGSETSPPYAMTADTWYRAEISCNAGNTQWDFKLYTCSDGVLVWSAAITNYFPNQTGYGVPMVHGALFYKTSTTATEMLAADYMDVYVDRTLTR